jgi:NAD(P)-dependent dehydrogenase (short-subunit alcohol dehydrogenase family)
MGELDGKSVIVTGAGRGLGRAYAAVMAEEGAHVVVNDIDAEEAEDAVAYIASLGGTAVANNDSVADWTASRRIVEQCVDEFGAVDAIVNNAGIYYVTPFIESTEEEFDRTIAVNLKGAFNLARHAVDHMVPQRSGSIINVTSGAQAGLPDRTAYGASKAGIAGFTYALALDLAQYNIRVNAISPVARTRMTDTTVAAGHKTGSQWPPENVAPLVAFLASDHASNVTGQVVRLEGNILSLVSHPEPVHPVILQEGWTVDSLRQFFNRTLGRKLQPVGLLVPTYRYGEGLNKAPPQ